MKARLDSPFEIWGGFRKVPDGSPFIHGRLYYDPEHGVKLDLVENPGGIQSLGQGDEQSLRTIYGQLVDGTPVTLSDCFISRTSVQIGIGIGSPTTLVVNRALFGRHVADMEQMLVREYSQELSSLSTWTCAPSAKVDLVKDKAMRGVDISYRIPNSITVPLPDRQFDVRITHSMSTSSEVCTSGLKWSAAIAVLPHDALPLETVNEIAWQFQNLMSLLIGARLSTRMIAIIAHDNSTDVAVRVPALKFVYHQRGRHDHKDLYPPQMLLPYSVVKDEFPTMVGKWFGRPTQAVLATNVFFGSQDMRSTAVDVRFMAAAQAAESFHRSLGTGLYMDQAAYDDAVQELANHIPPSIQGDHRQSLKNRLKYGNEHSLRKRLMDMLRRIPEDTGRRIAGDVEKFVVKVVDTRNYLAHYDGSLQANAFEGKALYAAAERLRILVTVNLLHDLGIKDEDLATVLERSREFKHWLSEPLIL